MIEIEKLHAYVDGELEGQEKAQVESLIVSDPAAAREVQSLTSLKRALSAQAKPVEDEAAWKACVGRLNEIDRAKGAERFMARYAYALCSVLFLVIVSAGLFNRAGFGPKFNANDVTRMTGNFPLIGVPSNTGDWLSQEIGSPPTTIPLQVLKVGTGTHQGYRYAKLVIQDHGGPMELVIVPGLDALEGTTPLDEKYSQVTVQDTQAVVWREYGQLMILVGPRDTKELRSVAEKIEIKP
jgi:hypothetical protein